MIAARRSRLIETAEGGEQRAHSVRNALRALAARVRDDDWIMVHDAARPCFSSADLQLLKRELASHPVGGLLAVPLADTLKRALEPGAHVTHVDATIDRDGLWRAATPQVFRCGVLLRALEAALDADRTPTDEAQAIEWSGQRPRLVAGRADNIKVTTADDLALAAAILSVRACAGVQVMRIGSGFDVHAFGPGDSIVLGGVRIPHTRGVVAHSDGDVVLHALCDALLGAAGLGDIGMHFPDTDPVWKGADSRRFVAAVLEMLSVRKLKVGNADITLLAQIAQGVALSPRDPPLAGADARGHREPGEHQGHHHRAPGFHRPQRRPRGAGHRVVRDGARTRMIPDHWRRAALAPPTAWGEPLGTGVLRATPEDFEVDEILGFAASGEGPHALLRVRKRGANTEWVARELARAAGVKPFEVGFAGLKDRNAVTTQHFTVPRGKTRGGRIHRPRGRGLRSAQRRARTSASCRAARSRATAS